MKQMRAQRKANLKRRLRGVFRVVRLGPYVNINNKQEAKEISRTDRKLFSSWNYRHYSIRHRFHGIN